MARQRDDHSRDFAWRRSAPAARRAAIVLFSWQSPSLSFFAGLLAAMPFIAAAFFAPALLSLSPTIDMLKPVADARAALAGQISLETTTSPFYLILLLAADLFAETPGRIHLVSKALGAVIVVIPLAYFCVSRLPIVAGLVLTGAVAGFVASPFSGPAELGLALFLVCGFCFLSPCADPAPGRARFEGVLAGNLLFALWLLNPVFSLAAFLALSACPFLSGPRGLTRYAATLAVFALLAGLSEFLLPGINVARAAAASGTLSTGVTFSGGESSLGLGGVAVSAVLVLMMTTIFGGREHMRGALSAACLGVVAFMAARFADANALPAFVFASTVAAFSVASPFYDGLFRNHDRASVAAALGVATLSVFWAGAIVVQSAGQFSLQHRTAQFAPEHIRTELALVQPGGPMIAQWIEEGRFSTPEARELLALAPVDQSAMLLEAASRARAVTAGGHDVAILAGADAACLLADKRSCRADSNDAVSTASVVFVPRLTLGPSADAAKGRAEAELYTQFTLVEQTPFWEIWVRRGAGQAGALLKDRSALAR